MIDSSLHPEQYRFGAENMIAYGGDHYRSEKAYVGQMKKYAINSLLIFLCLSSVALFIIRKKRLL
jgi:hypothetical protein